MTIVARDRTRRDRLRLLAVVVLVVVALGLGAFVIARGIATPQRTTPIYDPPVLAGQQLWSFCSGGFYARRGETNDSIEVAVDDRHRLEERELVHAALHTLASLPARDRDVIAALLTDDDEMRRALAPATFRKRLERALGRLRTSWRSRHGTL